MSNQTDKQPDKNGKSQSQPQPPEPAPAPGVVVTRKPNGIVITNYTGGGA